MDIADRIYQMLDERHLNQAAIARAIGLTPQVFNGMLKRRRPFRVQYIAPLCEALNCEPNELFGYEKWNRQITVTTENGEVVAVITNDSAVEHKGYHVILS